jgi:hypothetical protein
VIEMPRTTTQLDEAAARAEEWLEQLDPGQGGAKDARPLRKVHEAFRAVVADERVLAQAVQDARDAGFSWAAIGNALGISRQAALQRYGAGSG